MKQVAAVFFLLAFSFCKTHKPAASIFNQSDSDSLFIEMERSVCFGACPWYNVKIYESGYTVYDGKKFVDKNGVHTTELTKEELKQLKDEAQKINFLNLNDRYDNKQVTDLPSTQISVQINGTRKSIYDRFESPKELENFEKLIDQILDSKDWNKRMPMDKPDEKLKMKD